MSLLTLELHSVHKSEGHMLSQMTDPEGRVRDILWRYSYFIAVLQFLVPCMSS